MINLLVIYITHFFILLTGFAYKMNSSFRSGTAKAIFAKCASSELYPSCLRQFYGINSKLKKEGISAPQDVSVANTKRLYELIGRPLDEIPTLHVGGTNGKVCVQLNICSMTLNKLSSFSAGNNIF